MSQSVDGPAAAAVPRYTQIQGQYLAFIYAYSRIQKQPPAEADMRRHFGVTAPSVHQMVLTLEKAGLITRAPGAARSIKLLVPPEALPILRETTRHILWGRTLGAGTRVDLQSQHKAADRLSLRGRVAAGMLRPDLSCFSARPAMTLL
jgi:SOS-response transcriptional repressor LexA